MTDEMQFRIGTEARCSDGSCGTVVRVVINPVARTVTHLVVEPKHHKQIDRLVPLALVDVTRREVRLHCTLAEFDKLEAAESTQFLPRGDGYGGDGAGRVTTWPYYSVGAGGLSGVAMSGFGNEDDERITSEKLPAGEVAVWRGERVHATDGDIGQVEGVVVGAGDHKVTHVVLEEGHLWGRKEVAIPVSAVERVDGSIRLTITKEQVQHLPATAVG